MSALLIAAPLLPLLLALLSAAPRLALRLSALAPWASLPALLLALGGTTVELHLPWLGLGLRLVVDPLGRPFLLVGALLWWLAGRYVHAWLADHPRRSRFLVLFLTAQTGYLGLVLGYDPFTVLSGAALMTFAGYGLLPQRDGASARRAGLVYIVLMVGADGLLFEGLVLRGGADEQTVLSTLLLLLGFGAKTGAFPLYLWLGAAHRVRPPRAAAVMGAAMAGAGMLGALRFLPLGETAAPILGETLTALGLLGAVAAAAVGFVRGKPRGMPAGFAIARVGRLWAAAGDALAHAASAVRRLATELAVRGVHAIARMEAVSRRWAVAAGAFVVLLLTLVVALARQ